MAQLAEAIRKQVEAFPDQAAAALAITYAEQIDTDGKRAEKLGPLLLQVMESLLMTPRSRAAVRKGGGRDGKRANPLDELRDRRAARERDSQAVDTASS